MSKDFAPPVRARLLGSSLCWPVSFCSGLGPLPETTAANVESVIVTGSRLHPAPLRRQPP